MADAIPIDPSSGDWYKRGMEHLQRGNKVKALLCWERYIALEPNSSNRSNIDGLRSTFHDTEWNRYTIVKQNIDMHLEDFPGKIGILHLFNLPGLLGIESVDISLLNQMAHGSK